MRSRPFALAAATLALALTAAGPAAADYRYERSFGQPGSGPYGFGEPLAGPNLFLVFKSPVGLALDPQGNLWVADALNSRIAKFSADGQYLGRLVAGGRGRADSVRTNILPGSVFRPEGITFSAGQLFIAMNGNDRVEQWALPGRLVRIFNVRRPYSKFFGTGRGAGRGQVHNPFGIARSRAGVTYVADLNNGRVNMYGPKGSSRGSFGTFGEGDGQFLAPYGVAVGPDGSVYVSDRELSRIQRFDAAGRLLSVIGGPGDGPGQFLSPMGLATDRVGNLYVSDLSNYRIEKLTADGHFIEQFGDESHLQSPTYLAVDQGCTVYVADYRRVVKYASASGC